MRGFGYSRLDAAAFLSFGEDVDRGAWGAIDIVPYRAPATGSAAVVAEIPFRVALKLRLVESIDDLARTISGAEELPRAERTWDSKQRKLYALLCLALEDDDPLVRSAANRLWSALVLGEGLGQTQLAYDAEVDFGRTQIRVTSERPLSDDVALLELGPTMEEIRQATEALSLTLGRTSVGDQATNVKKTRQALLTCRRAFNGVHDDLEWLVERSPAGVQREQARALLSPLEALIERNQPAATAKPTEPKVAVEEPA